MAFTVTDFHDLIDLLTQHPEWRIDMRRLVLTDELLALPTNVDRLTAAVNGMAEAQDRTEARVQQLAEAQDRTEARSGLAEARSHGAVYRNWPKRRSHGGAS